MTRFSARGVLHKLETATVGIGREKTYSYTRLVWSDGVPMPLLPKPFSLTAAVATGKLKIPVKLIENEGHASCRNIIDPTKFSSEDFISKNQYSLLIAELCETRYRKIDGTLCLMGDKDYHAGFANYILTGAGVRWPARLDFFTSKDLLRGVKGAKTEHRKRMLSAGFIGMMDGLCSWDKYTNTDDFINCTKRIISNYMLLELHNIRGEIYGLPEEIELSMKRMLGGEYNRYRIVAKAISWLQKRNYMITVEAVLNVLEEQKIAPTRFGLKPGSKIESSSVRKHIAAFLNPVKQASYECLETVNVEYNFAVGRDLREISTTIVCLQDDDLQAQIMGRPQTLNHRHLEGYDLLLVVRQQMFEAMSKTSKFTAKDALCLDLLFFSDLPFADRLYVSHDNSYELAKLRAELAFAKNSIKASEIKSKIQNLEGSVYIEVPDVMGDFDIPCYGKITIPAKGFKNTFINMAGYRLAEFENDMSGRHIAESIGYIQFLINSVRVLGLLNPNNKNCLPAIKQFYLDFHGLLDCKDLVIPSLRFGPSAEDCSEGSSWRKQHYLRHWKLRQKTVSNFGRPKYDTSYSDLTELMARLKSVHVNLHED